MLVAIGGFVVPALFYAALNWGNSEALRGWAIPAATDIAFAIGICALLGRASSAISQDTPITFAVPAVARRKITAAFDGGAPAPALSSMVLCFGSATSAAAD